MKSKINIIIIVSILIIALSSISLIHILKHNEVKIEAASAFYPFATNLIENIYGKKK